MDGFTLTSEIIKALAWPVSAIIIVLLLRKPLVELVPLMKKLKYKELELEFSQEVLALKTEVKLTPDEPIKSEREILKTHSKAMEMLPLSTRSAIMEAWIEVETAAVEVASSFWTQSPSETMHNFPRLGEYLHQCKVIDDKQLSVFQRLRQLRNKAAHAEELNLNEEDTKSFIVMAFNLAEHIRNA